VEKRRGRKRTLDYQQILIFVAANPTMLHADIAARFKTTKRTICRILCGDGIVGLRRGRPIKLKPGQSDLEYEWEKSLHDAGLGMDRGLRLGSQRILYGYDPRKESPDDDSATSNSSL
jgi:hypothetical protein